MAAPSLCVVRAFSDEIDSLYDRLYWFDDRTILRLGGPLGPAAGLVLPGHLFDLHGSGSNPHGPGAAPGTNEAGAGWNRSPNSVGHASVHAWLLDCGRAGRSLARVSDRSTGLANRRSRRFDRLAELDLVGVDSESLFFASGANSNGARAPFDHQRPISDDPPSGLFGRHGQRALRCNCSGFVVGVGAG